MMIARLALIVALLAPTLASAEMVVTNRAMRAGTIISADDVRVLNRLAPSGAYNSVDEVIGQETRVSLYPGRAILTGNIGAPTVVERNAIVRLYFLRGGLSIRAEGRALANAGMGERLRVMNLESKLTVTGVVTGPSSVTVSR